MHHKVNNFIVLVTFWLIEIIFNLGCISLFFFELVNYISLLYLFPKKNKKWLTVISHLNVLSCPNR